MEDWLFYSLTNVLYLLCLRLLRARSPGKARHADSSTIAPLPLGPKPLSVLGPLLILARRDFDVEPMLRRIAREHGLVFTFAPLGQALQAIFVADRATAHRTLVQRGAAFASRPPVSASSADALLTSGGRNIDFN